MSDFVIFYFIFWLKSHDIVCAWYHKSIKYVLTHIDAKVQLFMIPRQKFVIKKIGSWRNKFENTFLINITKHHTFISFVTSYFTELVCDQLLSIRTLFLLTSNRGGQGQDRGWLTHMLKISEKKGKRHIIMLNGIYDSEPLYPQNTSAVSFLILFDLTIDWTGWKH